MFDGRDFDEAERKVDDRPGDRRDVPGPAE